MPTYLTPGIYVEELPPSGRPIDSESTSIAAFVGLAPGGPVDQPRRISSWSQFAQVYGDPSEPYNGPFMPGAYLAYAVWGYFLNGGEMCWVVRVAEAGDTIGDPARRSGMGGLMTIDEITMVCAPDLALTSADELVAAQQALLAYCEGGGDRMAILDPPMDLLPQEVLDWRINAAGHDSSFAALYWPWVDVLDPITSQPLSVPPCGHMAGIWARTDMRRGVHKAPANEVVIGTIGLGFSATYAEQGALNPVGINCLRYFPARGIRVWGARTLSSDPEWRYINHRRLTSYVSESLIGHLGWAAYEPNDPGLWVQIEAAAASFLTRLWRTGALLGSTPQQAFYVRCDESVNEPETVQSGLVYVEIGLAVVRPAEFVVFRLSHFAGGAGA